MQQKISTPVAIVIVIIVAIVLCGALYKKYMYQPTYSAQDIAAKFRAATGKGGAPPSAQPQPGANP
jgi:uncharacterized protein YpmB